MWGDLKLLYRRYKEIKRRTSKTGTHQSPYFGGRDEGHFVRLKIEFTCPPLLTARMDYLSQRWCQSDCLYGNFTLFSSTVVMLLSWPSKKWRRPFWTFIDFISVWLIDWFGFKRYEVKIAYINRCLLDPCVDSLLWLPPLSDTLFWVPMSHFLWARWRASTAFVPELIFHEQTPSH